MKAKKIIAMLLAATAIVGTMAGCGEKKENDSGKVSITVGGWPSDTAPERLERQEALRTAFIEKNPDIDIKGDTWAYDTKTFTMKASANQLPTVFNTWLTEMTMMISQEYVADITDIVKETGYYDAINPDLWELVTGEDGKIYGIPNKAYAQGLCINKRIFKEAGLVEADGVTPKVPKTYEELAEYAKIIKEKTGVAGLAFPTVNNCGGWHFMNIAWSYGVEFCKLDGDKWVSSFDTAEAREALSYIKDLKWKYDGLLTDSVVTSEDLNKWVGSYQAGMMIGAPPATLLAQQYGMDIDDIYFTGLPAGPKGSYSQTGADIYVFAKDATEEEIKAAIKWLKFTGFSPEVTDEELENSRTGYENQKEQGAVILYRDAFQLWTSEERNEKIDTVRNQYVNTKPENFETYFAFDGVQLHGEPEACAQQLYAILDGIIQEVITNKDADVDALITDASKDYQVNHLDKM